MQSPLLNYDTVFLPLFPSFAISSISYLILYGPFACKPFPVFVSPLPSSCLAVCSSGCASLSLSSHISPLSLSLSLLRFSLSLTLLQAHLLVHVSMCRNFQFFACKIARKIQESVVWPVPFYLNQFETSPTAVAIPHAPRQIQVVFFLTVRIVKSLFKLS